MREATGPGMEPLPTGSPPAAAGDRPSRERSQSGGQRRTGTVTGTSTSARREFHDRVRRFSLESNAVIEWANAHRLADTRGLPI